MKDFLKALVLQPSAYESILRDERAHGRAVFVYFALCTLMGYYFYFMCMRGYWDYFLTIYGLERVAKGNLLIPFLGGFVTCSFAWLFFGLMGAAVAKATGKPVQKGFVAATYGLSPVSIVIVPLILLEFHILETVPYLGVGVWELVTFIMMVWLLISEIVAIASVARKG